MSDRLRVCAAIILTLLAFIVLALGIHRAPLPSPVPLPAETTSSWVLPLAVATEPAVRVSTTVVRAPFDCATYVNALPYEWMNLVPVHAAYRVTARCLGWSMKTVDRWENFIVEDVIRNESGGCWNLRRGARVDVWLGCRLSRQGTREDSGFGQLIGIWWRGPGTPVCDRLILCSSNDIVASPWNSMRALLIVVETDGRGPWCYDARARRFHPACGTVSRYWQ